MHTRGILGAVALTLGLTAFGVASSAPVGAAAPAPVVDHFGSAPAFAQVNGPLSQSVVAMASDPSGPGYWMVASDGGIFTAGHAHFFGSTGALHLAQPIVAMAATPTGRGYWLAAADGGIFTFGDAAFKGSAALLPKSAPIVSMAPSASGRGYVLLGSNGVAYSFGDAPNTGATSAFGATVAIARAPLGGYLIVGLDGTVHAVAGAEYHGSAVHLDNVAVGIAPTIDGHGYWVAHVSTGILAPPNSGTGRRIVYSVSAQRVWTVEANGAVSHFWKVSGRRGTPPPGTYAIVSRTPMSYSGTLRLPWMQRFYKGAADRLWAGFHGIPLRPDGTPIESDAQLGIPLSHGCVRMNQTDVKTLWDWAPLGTAVVVLV
mgnify:CR=1 FL=1